MVPYRLSKSKAGGGGWNDWLKRTRSLLTSRNLCHCSLKMNTLSRWSSNRCIPTALCSLLEQPSVGVWLCYRWAAIFSLGCAEVCSNSIIVAKPVQVGWYVWKEPTVVCSPVQSACLSHRGPFSYSSVLGEVEGPQDSLSALPKEAP